jgi:hypothetical protein
MSVVPFDSGAVLERASPVLTFATDLRVTRVRGPCNRQNNTVAPLPAVRPNWAASRDGVLPVIPRIVRRTMLDSDGLIVRTVAHAAATARRSALAGLICGGLVLASLGAFAGVAIRSLSDPAQPAMATAMRAADATAIEYPLIRALSAPRVEQAGGASASLAAPSRARRSAGGADRAAAPPTVLWATRNGGAARPAPARPARSYRPATGPPSAASAPAHLPAPSMSRAPAALRAPPAKPKRR